MMWLPFFHSLSLKGPVPIEVCMILALRTCLSATSFSVKPCFGSIGVSLGWNARIRYGTGAFSFITTVDGSGVSMELTLLK